MCIRDSINAEYMGEITITQKLQSVKKRNYTLNEILDVIGTSEDTIETSQQMRRNIQDNTNDLKSLKNLLENLNTLKLPSKKMADRQTLLIRKLNQFFNEERDKFALTVKKLEQKEHVAKEQVKSRKTSFDRTAATINLLDDHEEAQTIQHVEWNEEVLNERDKDITEIGKAVVELKEIMEDIAVHTENQAQTFEIVSSNLYGTKENIRETNRELTRANTLNKSSLRQYWYLILIIGVVLVIFYFALHRSRSK
eukprot:TRINITY_DN12423_c0_g1_i4.p1 TRINITY_DN12423_c0_g1~~TRINITY_DN12423_c0_g1_i4.p1  ORF type:complete len:273 (+),score=61.90 TRINITY_DN12423_c0_g1_i4:61-819(+)